MELFIKSSWFIIIFSFLFAKDYYISFSFSSLNYTLNVDEFNCVRALTQNSNSSKFLFKIPTNYEKIENVCKYQKDTIVNNLLKSNIYSFSFDNIKNSKTLKTYSKITYIPKRFDIIIKNGFAYFYLKGD